MGRLRPQRARLLGGVGPVPVRCSSGSRPTCWLVGLGFAGVAPALAWNTAVSFVTNTNWQSYSGESTMGHLVQMAGLAVQNFVSAAVGIAVAVALVRGFARKRRPNARQLLGRPDPDRVRILLPIAGRRRDRVRRRRHDPELLTRHRRAPRSPARTQHITGGPVASQEVIKELGTNGGGFYNANSAHPFENPTTWTNWLEIFLLLVISFSLPRTFGRMVGDNRQGYAIVAVMAIMALGSVIVLNVAPGRAPRHGAAGGRRGDRGHRDPVRRAALGDLRHGDDADLDRRGRLVPRLVHRARRRRARCSNMMLGEVAPGGTGSGLYGMLILAVITVFVAGLMVGRTPEYLGKKIGAREMKFASLYFLTTPTLVLVGTGVAMALPRRTRRRCSTPARTGCPRCSTPSPRRQQQRLRVRRHHASTPTWYNTALGLAMLLGRFLPIVFVLGLAGSLARQQPVPASAGTLPTHRPLFVGMLVGVTLDRRRAHLPPRARARPARGRPALMTRPRDPRSQDSQTQSARSTRQPSRRRRRIGGGLLDPKQLWTSTAGRAAQAQPAHAVAQPGDVHRRDRLGLHHRARDRRSRPSSPG